MMEASAMFVATGLRQSLFPPATQVGFGLEAIRQIVITRKLQSSKETHFEDTTSVPGYPSNRI